MNRNRELKNICLYLAEEHLFEGSTFLQKKVYIFCIRYLILVG